MPKRRGPVSYADGKEVRGTKGRRILEMMALRAWMGVSPFFFSTAPLTLELQIELLGLFQIFVLILKGAHNDVWGI